MAETYGVIDLRALPLQTAAVLARGLHPDSRIMQRLIEMDEKQNASSGFDTPEAFLAARARFMEAQDGN